MTRTTDPAGLTVAGEESARLRAALMGVGLDLHGEWDSLDVVCAVVALEHSLGIVLDPGAVDPRQITDLEALTRVIGRGGRRRSPRARLTIELPGPADEDGAGDERERRRIEYRLSLAHPQLRVSVSRSGPLRIIAATDIPAGLPLQPTTLRALSLADTRTEQDPVPEFPALPLEPLPAADPAHGAAVERIEAAVRKFVHRNDGQLWPHASPLISIGELRDLGYFEAHPEQVFQLGPDVALLPAACLGSFRQLGQAEGAVLATFTATVFRRERFYESAAGRLPAFTCRELLWAGEPEHVNAITAAVTEFLTELAESLGLRHRWTSANDPFFLADSAHGSKLELRAEAPAGEIALASVNEHGRHFGCALPEPGWTTGCAGLGLERWALAVAAGRDR